MPNEQPNRSTEACLRSIAPCDPAETADRVGILHVLGLYGHIMDESAWDKLEAVFTPDAVFETTAPGRPVLRGIPELRDGFSGLLRPVAHLTTNSVVLALSRDDATCLSKWYAISRDARTPSRTGDYLDTLVRTPDGWRIAHRRAIQREFAPVDAASE